MFLGQKRICELLKGGDVIYVKKIKDNKFSLKQVQKLMEELL